jgi:hypothetical protein
MTEGRRCGLDNGRQAPRRAKHMDLLRLAVSIIRHRRRERWRGPASIWNCHGVPASATKRETGAIKLGEQGPPIVIWKTQRHHSWNQAPGEARRGEGVGVVSGLAMMKPESKQQCLETQHISVPALSVGLWSRLHCFALGELGCGLKLQGGLSSARPVFKATDPTWLVQPQLRHCLQGRLVGCRPSSSTCGPSALPSHRASATSFDLIPTFHPNALTSAPLHLAIQQPNEPYTILD